MNYYVWDNNQQAGPFTLGQLKEMWRSGRLTAAAQLCAEGTETWVSARDLLDQAEQAAPRTVASIDLRDPVHFIGVVIAMLILGWAALVVVSAFLT